MGNLDNFGTFAQKKGDIFVDFYQRYIELCNGMGKSPSAVAIEIGLSKTAVHKWKNGGLPTDSTAVKVASYFNVSVDSMMDFEKKKEQPTESELSIKKKEFIKKIEGMSDAQLDRLEQILALVEKTDL